MYYTSIIYISPCSVSMVVQQKNAKVSDTLVGYSRCSSCVPPAVMQITVVINRLRCR